MKNGKFIGKRILTFLLITAMLLPALPDNTVFVFAENETETEEYITDVTGLEVWDNVQLKESVTITDDVTVTGTVKMEPGVSVTIVSGKLITESQSVIEGDIYVEKSGIAEIYGTIKGTVYVNSTDSSVTVEDWNGSLVRARNFGAQSSSVIDTVILNGVGTGYIDGKVNTLKVDKKYEGDYGAETNSVIQNFEYCGKTDFYNCGHIYEAKVTGGHNFSNNQGATIERIVVSDGSFSNNGLVYFAIVEESGRLYNNNMEDASLGESRIDSVVVKENAEEIVIDGEIYRNLENYGVIGSLIAYGGEICTLGNVDYFYADNCKKVYIETASWVNDRDDYQVEYFYAKDTDISFEDFSDDRTKLPRVRTARIEDGAIHARDIFAEELYLSGSFSEIYLERAEIYSLYVAELDLPEQSCVKVPVPEEVVISDFKASEEAKDAYEMVTSELFERLNEEEQALLKEFVFETEELPSSGRTVEQQEFTKELRQYDIVTMEFSSDSAVGAVLAKSPSGYEVLVMSKDDAVTESFMAYESGEYTFRVIGDEYGANLDLDVTKSASVNFAVYTRYAAENPQDTENEPASLSEFYISVYDVTAGKEFNGFVVDGDTLLFRENPKGHTYAITLRSIAMDWEFEPETVEVTVKEGDIKVLEAIVKQYGDYYGYTADGAIPQVYFYDENGNFVRRADGDSYGNFWAGRLPSGTYTAILLRDDTGNYMFSNLESFTEYGLVEKEDFLKDTFTLEAGINICYPEINLPETPSVENIYFDNNLTSVNTNRQTTVAEELVQVTLNYALNEEYADKVSGLLFKFTMCENTEFINGSVTVDGNAVSGCTLEDGCLVVPAEKASGTICYQIYSSDTDVTLLTTANAEFILGGKEVKQLIGMTSVYITALSAKIQTVTNNGEISVTGYAAPDETVFVLDNGEIIGETTSNSSGYFSTMVSLPAQISRHKVCVARAVGTPSELRTEEKVVSVMDTAPQLLDFYMYYYVHGISARFHLSGEEFSTKRFTYDYWPGSVFTFELKMSQSEYIDKLYVVSNNGSVKKLEAFYDEAQDLWIASGIFSEDENYAPADFDIEYVLKEIDIATEIGDFDFWRDMTVDTALVDEIYESADKNFSEYVYDEESNTVSNTLTVTVGENEISCDYAISYQATDETKESLLEKGFEVEEIDGTEYFYKVEVDESTWLATTTMAVLVNTDEEVASAGELMLFSVADEEIKGPALLQQVLQCNVRDVVINQISAMPEIAKDFVFDSIPKGIDGVKDISKQIEAWAPYLGPNRFLTKDDREKLSDIQEIFEWIEVVSGVEPLIEQRKYFDKLKELERKLDAIEQARQEGKGGSCASIPLDSFYDDIIASYKAAGDLTNAKWSFAWVKKTCTAGADAAVSAKGPVKRKLPDGNIQELSVKDALKIGKFSTAGKQGLKAVAINQINLGLEKLEKLLSVDKLYEAGIDAMAGDTLDYWNTANAKHLEQLEQNINMLVMLSGADTGSAVNSDMFLKSSVAIEPLLLNSNGGSGGCYKPTDLEPYPGGTVPGGGGTVQWDPSGYVYEGVPSNRLEGVTATTYFLGEDGTEILWNAEEYGQVNPQVTDSQGCYGWFVPEGQWKVVYTKDGYEVAETEWLPVPPPQTEVNVGMVSMAAPEIKCAYVYTKYAVVVFDKYVDVTTVTDKTLSVNGLSGTVEPVNAENGTDGTILASKFRISFSSDAVIGKEYKITVYDGILGYNNIIVSAKEILAACTACPESIIAELPATVPLGTETTVKVTVTADGSTEGMKLECAYDSAFLEVVSIGDVSADGVAELVVKGKQAGVSLLKISVAGSDVTFEADAVTADEQAAGLMKYVERESNKSSLQYSPLSENGNQMVLWIMFLGIAFILSAGVLVAIAMGKSRKTA